MLKNENLKDLDKQLVTELTPEEAATIEGGYFLYLNSLECFEETPGWGSDEISIRVNGKQVAYHGDMDSGEFFNINLAKQYTNPVTVSIYEEDGWWSDDDYIGSVYISGATQPSTYKDLFGSNSHYRMTYQVF